MNTLYGNDREEAAYQCPVCGNSLPQVAALPPFDAPCSECGAYLWCRKRLAHGEVVLQAMPGRTPEPWEVDQVITALARQGREGRIVVDLSLLDIVCSSLIARLVTLSKEVHSLGGDFYLSGLRPVVRETFDRLRLDRLFHILDNDVHILEHV
jgi:anti-anti-sigma factor